MKAFVTQYIVQPYKRTLLAHPWFGPFTGGVLIAAAINVCTTAFFIWGGAGLAFGSIVALCMVAAAIVIINETREQRRRRQSLALQPVDVPRPLQHKGMVSLYGRDDVLREAIHYHYPTLKNCWLIVTPETANNARIIGPKMETEFGVHVDYREVANLWDTAGCYQVIKNVLDHEAVALRLDPNQIISDITGGTKPMTTGMVLACLEKGAPIEHVPTRYVDGKPTGPLPPIQICVEREGEPV